MPYPKPSAAEPSVTQSSRMRCLRIISQRSESERSFDSATAETSLPRVECCTRPRSVQDSGQDSKLRMTNVNSRRIRRTPGSRSNQKGLLTDRETESAEGLPTYINCLALLRM